VTQSNGFPIKTCKRAPKYQIHKTWTPALFAQLFFRVRFISIEPLLEPLGEIDLTAIDWVIVGGESGTGARPIHPAWWK
jgi:hypothetical protein